MVTDNEKTPLILITSDDGMASPGLRAAARAVLPNDDVDFTAAVYVTRLLAELVLYVTLTWRAELETDTSYRAFVHLLGPDGQLVDQSDGMPAGWTRPATGWLPGEYIVDVHALILPPDGQPGDHHIRVGLHGPDGERLVTQHEEDAVCVASITVDRHSRVAQAGLSSSQSWV